MACRPTQQITLHLTFVVAVARGAPYFLSSWCLTIRKGDPKPKTQPMVNRAVMRYLFVSPKGRFSPGRGCIYYLRINWLCLRTNKQCKMNSLKRGRGTRRFLSMKLTYIKNAAYELMIIYYELYILNYYDYYYYLYYDYYYVCSDIE